MGMQQAALQRFCSDDMEDHTGDERIHFDTRRLSVVARSNERPELQ